MSKPDIPYRELGRTREMVSAIGLGGWHLGLPRVDEKLAIRLVRTAIDAGVNFMDNSWDYNDGASEIRLGKALRDGGYRDRAFVMTKIDGRSRPGNDAPLRCCTYFGLINTNVGWASEPDPRRVRASRRHPDPQEVGYGDAHSISRVCGSHARARPSHLRILQRAR